MLKSCIYFLIILDNDKKPDEIKSPFPCSVYIELWVVIKSGSVFSCVYIDD